MVPNPTIMNAVEKLGYRVTVGDVATQAGLEINQAQQGLLTLASQAQGHLQVAESGDIAYEFPRNFRTVLRNKYWQLRWQETWQKIWRILFYLIRISFGIILILSLVLMLLAVAIMIITIQSSSDSDSDSGGNRGGGGFFFPRFWFTPDIFWLFDPSYDYRRSRTKDESKEGKMNFLESVFSFLFGDGDPNKDLEQKSWQQIGTVINNNQGAVVAEQIAPHVDEIAVGELESEDFMIPVLARFNGYPEVSPQGEIIYYFPELQVTATQQNMPGKSIPAYLQEKIEQFSQASGGQLVLASCLGGANFILAVVLGSMLQDYQVSGGLVALVDSIYWFLLAYGTAFLAIPLVRYFWLKVKNYGIKNRNHQRNKLASTLEQGDVNLRDKVAYARQFASQKVIDEGDLAYTTQTDLIEQNISNSEKIDAEWQRRLDSEQS